MIAVWAGDKILDIGRIAVESQDEGEEEDCHHSQQQVPMSWVRNVTVDAGGRYLRMLVQGTFLSMAIFQPLPWMGVSVPGFSTTAGRRAVAPLTRD